MSRRRLGALLAAALVAGALAAPAVAARGGDRPALFMAGAAKADITPPRLAGVYLGGYGIGPVHPAHRVLRHIYARALAIRGAGGAQVVIAALDLQGHFIAYQQGPYGFADVAADIQRRLGIPASHLLLQSTHTHNGPDDLGVWGGVPTSYLAYVKRQLERAITAAVRSERPAYLRWATINLPGFAGSFGSGPNGNVAAYPVDQQLRVLQAVTPSRHVIVTLANFSTHPTVYGPLDAVSPDWPGATATYLEGDELGMPAGVRYGFPGSVAVVTTGAVGHSWPAAIPRFDDPRLNPPKRTDRNYPADAYGNALARAAVAALRHPTWVRSAVVRGASDSVFVVNGNAALLAALYAPVPGLHIQRALTPPYMYGDVLASRVGALRIGSLLFYAAPGEAYPTLQTAMRHGVGATVVFPVSLAGDQLGYIGEPGDYVDAQVCSPSDEGFFMISPTFGVQVEAAVRQDASALGFRVADPGTTTDVTGSRPVPSTNCATSTLP